MKQPTEQQIYNIDTFEADGHQVPDVNDISNVNSEGYRVLDFAKFMDWAGSRSDEHIIIVKGERSMRIYKDGVYLSCVPEWCEAVIYVCITKSDCKGFILPRIGDVLRGRK